MKKTGEHVSMHWQQGKSNTNFEPIVSWVGYGCPLRTRGPGAQGWPIDSPIDSPRVPVMHGSNRNRLAIDATTSWTVSGLFNNMSPKWSHNSQKGDISWWPWQNLYTTQMVQSNITVKNHRQHLGSFLLTWINVLKFEVWEWISNFISHVNGQEISYPCFD